MDVKTYFIFALIFLFSLQVKSQSKNEVIDTTNINFQFLEFLVKEKIDSLRHVNSLKSLRNDSVLHIAAKDHADYLIQRKKMGHFEPDIPEKLNPFLRVKFHGGNDFYIVGENVVSTFIFKLCKGKHQKLHTAITYEQAAYDMMLAWRYSPPHFKNIKTATYVETGLAISYDNKTKNFKAVQVFGTEMGNYTTVENKEMFPYSNYSPEKNINSFDSISHHLHKGKHQWGLKYAIDTASICKTCHDAYEGYDPYTKGQNGRSVGLFTFDVEMVKKTLRHRRDGMAVEVVEYKPFDCGNPQYYTLTSRRNKQCMFNGYVVKPRYKRQLLKSWRQQHRSFIKNKFRKASQLLFAKKPLLDKPDLIIAELKKKWYPTSWSAFIGKIPKNTSGIIETNIIIIQRKRVCKVLHFTNYCGEHFDDGIQLNYQPLWNTTPIAITDTSKRVMIKVPFKRNETDYLFPTIKSWLDSSCYHVKYQITKCQVNAFASVEGDSILNQQLSTKRANKIIDVIRVLQKPDSFDYSIQVKTNWELFEKQIKTNKELYLFKGKSHKEVIEILRNKSILKRLNKTLNAQRLASIQIQTNLCYTPKQKAKLLCNAFNKISRKIVQDGKMNSTEVDSLGRIQFYIFNESEKNKWGDEFLKYINLPIKSFKIESKYESEKLRIKVKYETLIANQIYLYRDGTNSKKEMFKKMKDLIEKKDFQTPTLYYNYLLALNKQWYELEKSDNSLMEKTKSIFKNLYGLIQYTDAKNPVGPLFRTEGLKQLTDSLQYNYYFKFLHAHFNGRVLKKENYDYLNKISEGYADKNLDDTTTIKVAKFFNHYLQPSVAYNFLNKKVDSTMNHAVLSMAMKQMYVHKEEALTDRYLQLLLNAKSRLTTNGWCNLFFGECGISFQIFDHEAIRNLFCESCQQRRQQFIDEFLKNQK